MPLLTHPPNPHSRLERRSRSTNEQVIPVAMVVMSLSHNPPESLGSMVRRQANCLLQWTQHGSSKIPFSLTYSYKGAFTLHTCCELVSEHRKPSIRLLCPPDTFGSSIPPQLLFLESLFSPLTLIPKERFSNTEHATPSLHRSCKADQGPDPQGKSGETIKAICDPQLRTRQILTPTRTQLLGHLRQVQY